MAIDFLLQRKFCSLRQLERIIGNFTSMAMVRRPCLSILNAVYRFGRGSDLPDHKLNRDKPLPLWDSIVRELKWCKAVIPLLW